MTIHSRTPGVSEYKTKDGPRYRWHADFGLKPDGTRDQRSKGGFPTRKEAHAAKVEALRNPLIMTGGYSSEGDMRLADWLDDWLEGKEASDDIRPTTVGHYAYLIRSHIVPFLGATPLDKLTPNVIDKWQRDRLANLAPGTVRSLSALLKAALALAVERDLIPKSPFRGVKAPLARARAIVPWTPEQERTFLTATVDDPDAPLWRLLLLGGLRIGEALALRWGDVDLGAGAVRVERTLTRTRDRAEIIGDRPKTAAGRRTVTLPAAAVETLRAHRDRELFAQRGGAGDLVFARDDGRFQSRSVLSERLKKICVRLELVTTHEVTPHTLRHFHGTDGMRAGVHPSVMMKRMGHTSAAMLEHYTHSGTDEDRAAAKKISELLG